VKDHTLKFRVTRGEKESWQAAAAERGWSLSRFLRNTMNAAAGHDVSRETPEPDEPAASPVAEARKRLAKLAEQRDG
jgi:hypothetical protein